MRDRANARFAKWLSFFKENIPGRVIVQMNSTE
jgi:hypothetical protein